MTARRILFWPANHTNHTDSAIRAICVIRGLLLVFNDLRRPSLGAECKEVNRENRQCLSALLCPFPHAFFSVEAPKFEQPLPGGVYVPRMLATLPLLFLV